jgi:hypothetical protein
MGRLALLVAAVTVGFTLPIKFTVDICDRGTVIDFNTGQSVCVGAVVEHDRVIDTEQVQKACAKVNSRWTGVTEFKANGKMNCY